MHMVGSGFEGEHLGTHQQLPGEQTGYPYGPGQEVGERIGKRRGMAMGRMWGGVWGAAGGMLMAFGLTRQSPLTRVLGALAGGTMIGVGIAGSSGSKQLGRMGAGGLSQGSWMYLEDTVTVDAPITDVYHFARDLRHLSDYMPHVGNVMEHPNGRVEWTVSGPGGLSMMWTGRIVEDRPQESIMWRSDADNPFDEVGVVRFEKVSANQTEVIMSVRYRPRGGKAGAMAAKLLEGMSDAYMRQELASFKSAAERRMMAAPV